VSNLDVGYALTLPSLVDPRRGSSPPARCNVGFDRLVINMIGVGPDLLVPRTYDKMPFPLAGFEGWTMQRRAKDKRRLDDARFRRNVMVYADDEVLMATLSCEPAFPRLPELRLDLSGAAWRRGVAAALGVSIAQALAPMTATIAEAHVAIDLDADLRDFVPFVRDADVKWPRLPEMRAFLLGNQGIAAGYEWSRRDESVGIVVYDKIAQTRHVHVHALDELVNAPRRGKRRAEYRANAARRTEVPVHARNWSDLMRVEVRLKPGSAKRARDANGVLDAIRVCFAGLGLADLRLLDAFDTMAVLLGEARAYGFRTQPPDVKTMKTAYEPAVPLGEDESAAIEWPDFGSRVLKKMRATATTAIATAHAGVIHAAVLERLRALDSRAPVRLAEQFDRAEADLRATLAAMGVQ
jgi:hypothetical protein